MASNPLFPLPRGYFGDMRLTSQQEDQFRDIVRNDVAAALVEERELAANDRRVDMTKWKLAKQHRELQIFRRIKRTLEPGTPMPTMLGTGRFEATLEDAIFGTYAKSHEEFKMVMDYMDMHCKDSTVMQTIETATPEDPFHYLGLKWLLSGLPIVKQRDWCYIEAMGIEHDDQGKRYAYIVTHSVKLFDCPPFHRKVAIRGQVYFTYIFRENTPGMVDVFARGLYDPAGELIKQFSVVATSTIFMSLFKSVRCAEAKKLTLLAMSNRRRGPAVLGSNCSVCKSSSGFFSSLRMCRICQVTICTKCCVKKSAFAGPNYSITKLRCCANCIIRANEIEVRPAEPYCTIQASNDSMYEFFTASSSGRNHLESPRPTDSSNEASTPDNEAYENHQRISNMSGISETEVEDIIALVAHKTISEDHETDEDEISAAMQNVSWESSGSLASTVGSPADVEADQIGAPGARTAQELLFQKMIALQQASMHVYEMTRANNELMKSGGSL